jgi:hypothetical protein
MVDTLDFVIRHGKESDLPALEWEGEYARYRAVYRSAWEDVRRGERAILVAEVDDRIVGQIFIHFTSPWPVPGRIVQPATHARVRTVSRSGHRPGLLRRPRRPEGLRGTRGDRRVAR